MDPAVKMMTATLTKSTKKSGFGRIFLSGEERFFIPGEERFGKDEDSSYTLRKRYTAIIVHWFESRRNFMNITKEQLAQMIDHTNLKAFSDDAAFKKLCEEANLYGFKALAINGAQIERCKKYLGESQVHIGVTVGFPLGQMTIESKVFETRDAIEKGAHEIDYVLNVAELKNGITQACHDKGVICKVIFENCYLTDEEKRTAAEISLKVLPDFIKTSTGFGTGGATVEDVRLMKSVVGDAVKVKAAGGIRDFETAAAMIRRRADEAFRVTGCFSGKTEDRQIRLERSRIVGKAAERYSLREAVLQEKGGGIHRMGEALRKEKKCRLLMWYTKFWQRDILRQNMAEKESRSQ